MAQPVAVSGLPAVARDASRHSAWVRVTHWVTALSVLVLVLSGFAILLAHPRLYWGETGHLGTPSLIDLPLPFVLDVPIRGPGRYLHFLAAWVSLFAGLAYVSWGLVSSHFARNLLPARGQLTKGAIWRASAPCKSGSPPLRAAIPMRTEVTWRDARLESRG